MHSSNMMVMHGLQDIERTGVATINLFAQNTSVNYNFDELANI